MGQGYLLMPESKEVLEDQGRHFTNARSQLDAIFIDQIWDNLRIKRNNDCDFKILNKYNYDVHSDSRRDRKRELIENKLLYVLF